MHHGLEEDLILLAGNALLIDGGERAMVFADVSVVGLEFERTAQPPLEHRRIVLFGG
jgi:hypothetical protein